MPAKQTAAEKRAKAKAALEKARAKKKAQQVAAAEKTRAKKLATKTKTGPRKASPASKAARDAYIERRPMRGHYLDIDQIDFIEELRRSDPGAKIPSASEVVRAILREFMEHHPIGGRAQSQKKPAAKK